MNRRNFLKAGAFGLPALLLAGITKGDSKVVAKCDKPEISQNSSVSSTLSAQHTANSTPCEQTWELECQPSGVRVFSRLQPDSDGWLRGWECTWTDSGEGYWYCVNKAVYPWRHVFLDDSRPIVWSEPA